MFFASVFDFATSLVYATTCEKPSLSFDLGSFLAGFLGVLGVILTAFVTIMVARKEMRINSITNERSKWLAKFRDEINDLMAGINMVKHIGYSGAVEGKILEVITKADGARYEIISRLRTSNTYGNEYNYPLKEMLLELDFYDVAKMKTVDCVILMQLFNKVLELEWDKVKEESE